MPFGKFTLDANELYAIFTPEPVASTFISKEPFAPGAKALPSNVSKAISESCLPLLVVALNFQGSTLKLILPFTD